jgi:SNF family Na+-dependent transporter
MKDNFSVSPRGVRTILIGLILMVCGYILMIGGGSNDPAVFNDAMFDFRRMVASPVLVVLGILIVIVAIMKRPADREDKE